MLDWKGLADLMVERFGTIEILRDFTSLVDEIWCLLLRFKSHNVLLLARIILALIWRSIRSWISLIVFTIAFLFILILLLIRVAHLVSWVFYIWFFQWTGWPSISIILLLLLNLLLVRSLIEIWSLTLRIDICFIVVVHVGLILFFIVLFLIGLLLRVSSRLLRQYVLVCAQGWSHHITVVIRVDWLVRGGICPCTRGCTLDSGVLVASVVHDRPLVIYDWVRVVSGEHLVSDGWGHICHVSVRVSVVWLLLEESLRGRLLGYQVVLVLHLLRQGVIIVVREFMGCILTTWGTESHYLMLHDFLVILVVLLVDDWRKCVWHSFWLNVLLSLDIVSLVFWKNRRLLCDTP